MTRTTSDVSKNSYEGMKLLATIEQLEIDNLRTGVYCTKGLLDARLEKGRKKRCMKDLSQEWMNVMWRYLLGCCSESSGLFLMAAIQASLFANGNLKRLLVKLILGADTMHYWK